MALKRSIIVDTKLKQRLEGISIATGYYTNLGSNVNLRRPLKARPFEAAELPACNIRDTSYQVINEGIEGSNALWDREARVEIDLAAKDGTTYHQAVADVEKAIAVDETFDGTVTLINVEGDEGDVDQNEEALHAGIFTLTLQYRTKRLTEDL